MLSKNEKLGHIYGFLCTFHWCNNDNDKNTDGVPTIASSLWQRWVTHHCKHMTLHLLKPIDPTQTECAITYNTNAHGRTLVSLRTTPSHAHAYTHTHWNDRSRYSKQTHECRTWLWLLTGHTGWWIHLFSSPSSVCFSDSTAGEQLN